MLKPILAIIGGGRWGQVMMSVIADMHPTFEHVVIVSKANAAEVQDKINELKPNAKVSFEIISTIDELFAKHNVHAAIVVNAARSHFETARKLINRKIHVLIEKPIVLTTQQIQILIDEAADNNVCIVPALNYRFASYIKHFSVVVSKEPPPQHFYLEWRDAANETRHGRTKKHDATISVIQDVMPHVWTILSIVFQQPHIKVISSSGNTQSALITLSIDGIEGQVALQRDGAKRQRRLTLELIDGLLELDFTQEPGTISKNGRDQISGDAEWTKQPGPLSQQLSYFFEVASKANKIQQDLECCLNSVTITELAESIKSYPSPLEGLVHSFELS